MNQNLFRVTSTLAKHYHRNYTSEILVGQIKRLKAVVAMCGHRMRDTRQEIVVMQKALRRFK